MATQVLRRQSKSELDWFGTVRGRIGYAFDTSLVYFTGGFAYGGLDNQIDIDHLEYWRYQNDGTATGYVLGGGYEYKFSLAWSVKAEYQYINLGRNDPLREERERTLSSDQHISC